MKKTNTWFRYTAVLAVALLLSLALALVGCSGCGDTTNPDNGDKPGDTTVTEGPETGVYYYDAESGEYTIHLHSGNQFTLNDGVARVGTYTVSGESISFTFTKESNGTATATLAGDVLTLTYGEKTIRFIKKTEYTVTFNANGGEGAPASVKAVNGRAIAAVADPTKAGYAFIGWYADEALTTPYIFGSTPITADTTLYAKWVEKAAGQIEYTVSFDGADIDSMTTIGGKLYGVPTPAKDGYTFGGWWISMTEKADELTAVYTEDTVFTANTTLFALWTKTEGEKLAAPLVSVNANGITWPSVNGASTYAVKITAPDGSVVLEENVSSTTKNFDFAVAGMYTVEVTAVSTNTANNSAVTVRCYNAKAINRVSVFEVIDSTLIFNDVGADKYYITIVCGNENHNHSYVSNGASTVYNFANCEMKAGGIEFTVTAVKNGYASSVSKTFVCEKKLDKVTDLTVNAATETLVWTPVSGATYYAVEINGTVNYVNGASYSLKGYTGAITVKVTPVSAGYISEATEYTYEKATLAAPSNIVINGNLIKWDAVAGAKSYTVKVNGKEFTATTNSLDLALVDAGIKNGQTVEISIKTVADGKESVYSDAVIAKSLAFDGELVYKNGVISWTPVIGKGSYEVKVNGGDAVTVSDANSYAVKFTKAGVNTVSVRFVGDVTTEWITEEITVYAILFDSRLGAAVEPIYVVKGDSVVLPAEVTRPGYVFNGWYNTPNASAGSGAIYNAPFYTESGDIVLYADWKANTYKIEYSVDADTEGVTNGSTVDVVFGNDFALALPTRGDGSFLGWFTGPGGSGIQVTDALGNSTGKYTATGNTTVYPFFEIGTLTYVEQADGTWGVTAGPNIRNVANVIIPETYKGIKVTKILENAFKSCDTLKTISIPNTVNLIGTGAFLGCYEIEAVDVRVIEGSHDVIYSSYEGALIREYLGTTYLEYYPVARKGDYTVPATVDSIRNKAFQYADYLENLTISKEVTYIADQAFFHCLALKNITFEAGGSSTLVIDEGAFLDMRKLETITLPARMAEVDLVLFDECPGLKSLNVEEGGAVYGSKDGMLTNGDVDTIIYTPITITGDITIPVGITAIGEGAFANRAGITSVTVSNKVTEIGKGAFAGSNYIKNVTFIGGRNTNLVIGESAFENCASLTDVSFIGITRAAAMDVGTVTIGNAAFKGCSKLANVNYVATANVVAIGDSAFENCTALTKIVIPAKAASIGSSAFAGCSKATSVEFAEGASGMTPVEYQFGDSVFAGCATIKTVNLPATVTKFPASGFVGCDSIVEITVDKNNPALFAEDGVLYNKAQTEVMYYPKAKEVDFTKLPASLTTIGAGAFQSNPKITSITIPANITEIGAYAFDSCVNLTEIKFASNNDIKLGEYVFANCPELKGIELPAATTAIGDYAFYMSALESFTLPATVKSIGAYAFAYTKIAELNITAAVETVGEGAFYSCKSLKNVTVEDGTAALTLGGAEDNYGVFQNSALTSIVFSKRIESIGKRAFFNLTSLTTATIPADAQLKAIGSYAFGNTKIAEIVLPEGLETIADWAFYATSGLTSVTIPSTVTVIGNDAFNSASNITSLTFAEGTAELTINDNAFVYMTALENINFPARLVKIYNDITVGNGIELTSFYTLFNGCTKLANITVTEGCANFSSVDGVFYANNEAGKPETLIFCPRAKTGTVNVPSTVTRVENLAFYKTNKLEAVIFEDVENFSGKGTLSIGDPEYYRWANTHPNYAVFTSTSIKLVDLPVQLGNLGTAAFYDMSAEGLELKFDANGAALRIGVYGIHNCSKMTSLELPKVEEIYENAISTNSMVTTLTFGKGSTLTEIPAWGISYMDALTAFEVPASVKSIGNRGITSCKALASITFEKGTKLTTLDSMAFQANGLTSFVFPETVETIGSQIFHTNHNLATLTLPAKLKSIYASDGGTILQYSSLKEVIVPESNKYMVVKDGILYNSDMTVLMFVPSKMDHTNVVIPDTVTSIEDYAFYDFTGDKLDLPDGLVKIGAYAFGKAKNVKTLEIPASVKSVGNYAFTQMSALEAITFAEGSTLESIGASAFDTCGKLKAIVLPDSIKTLGGSMFSMCWGLESAVLPSGIKEIPRNTFWYCDALTSVTIYEGVSTIREGAFQNCTALETVTIPASVHTIEYVYGGVFEGCTGLKNVIFAEGSKLTQLDSNTFRNCTSLESIVLPESLSRLEANVFGNCKSLTSVTILGDVTAIPANFFAGYDKLTTVVLPETVTEIGANAFDGCAALKEITVPAGIETIGAAAFRGCASLEAVSLGANLTSIGDFAFDGCAALADVTFAEGCGITELGSDATVESAIFRGTAIKTIALPETVRTIGANVFENSALESITLPASLVAVSNYAFSGCESLASVSIPQTVKGIGDYAFADCAGLKTVEIAFGVESIGTAAFLNCVALESVNIPATIGTIAGNPFVNCPSLSNMEFDEANTDYKFVDGALFDSSMTTLIYYLPGNAATEYKAPDTVREFAAGAFYGSQLVSVTIPDSIKAIPEMLFMDSKNLQTVIIPKSVKSIGNKAFYGCTALASVTINETVDSIGDYAFANCTALASVNFNDRNTAYTIGANAFEGCSALTEIKLAEGITALAPYMFANTGLVSATIPASVTNVNAEGVFANNAKLVSVVFGEGAEGILGNKFFYNCTALTEVALPAGITQLGKTLVIGTDYDGNGQILGWEVSSLGTTEPSYAFYGCTALKKVEIPGVYNIGAYAFYGCTSLENVVFGQYVSVIGDYAFAECTGLVALDMSATEVWTDGGNYPGTAEIGAFAFYNCSALEDLGLPYKIHLIRDGAFEGCNAIKVLTLGNISAPPSGGFNGCPFRGWTSEQTIFFEYHTSAQRFNFIDLPDWGVFPGFTSDWTKNHEAAIVFKDEAK